LDHVYTTPPCALRDLARTCVWRPLQIVSPYGWNELMSVVALVRPARNSARPALPVPGALALMLT
jgi:hypothetical protein